MSHSPERKEKNRLNCGTIVRGRICHVCGQENTEPKETFFGMVTHFFNDITHFDGKFFTTLKDLLFKPGFLSAEYMRGRRMSYLNPIRMYVFTSAIFFLIFFSLFKPKDTFKITEGNEPLSVEARDSIIQRVEKKLRRDTANVNLKKKLEVLKEVVCFSLLQNSTIFEPNQYQSLHEKHPGFNCPIADNFLFWPILLQ